MSTPLSSRETYEVVDLLNGGDVLAVYSDRAKAIRDAYALVDEHPDLEGDIVVIHFDSRHVRMGYDDILIPIWPAEQAPSEAQGPCTREQADPGSHPLDEGVRSAAPAEQTTDRAHDEDRVHGSWIVYEHNGGENGHTDRVYGPYHDRKQAGRVASYINTFTTVLGRAWVLPLRDPKDGPDPLGDPDA